MIKTDKIENLSYLKHSFVRILNDPKDCPKEIWDEIKDEVIYDCSECGFSVFLYCGHFVSDFKWYHFEDLTCHQIKMKIALE